MRAADELLRARDRFEVDAERIPWVPLLTLLCAGGLTYGAVMGAYSLRALQTVFSALKVPLLLALSSVVCLPSFYVVNTVLGLREDFGAACRGVFAAQATVAVTLAAMAPVLCVVYASSVAYGEAVVANGAMFLIAAIAGQATLSRHYAPLIRKSGNHRFARAVWLVLYVFVAVQLAWVLRPFVGAQSMPTQFFRDDAWSNAYVAVAETLRGVFAR